MCPVREIKKGPVTVEAVEPRLSKMGVFWACGTGAERERERDRERRHSS